MIAPRPIAVVLDGPPTPAWQARALTCLEASDVLEVVELRLAGAPRRGAAHRLRVAAGRHIFSFGADPHALTRLLPSGHDGSPATLVVWLSERPPQDESRDLLSLRHGSLAEPAEDAFRRAGASNSPCVVSEVLLQAEGRTVVVERTVSAAGPFLETSRLALVLWKLAALTPRAAVRLPGLDEPAGIPQQVGPPPSNAALLMRDAASWVRVPATRLLFQRPWRIRVRERGDSLTAGWRGDACLVRWGDGRVYADPFLFEYEGRHHLFCEEVPRGAKRGVISHTELRLDGTPAHPPTPVLQVPYHLSYPCVFAHEGEVFMIPETAAVRQIELYRAVSFPDAWEREVTLVDGVDAVDPTLFEHDGRLWLFAAVAAPDASYSDELHIFWAQTLRGPWHRHQGNPVVSDVRGARPAGAIQRWGPRIVRPAQDCSRRYGWAVSFREIDLLTTTAYAEHEIDRLEPANLGDARATHTYAGDSRFEAVDLRQRELRLRRGARRRSGSPWT